ncbi:MAG: FAD-dependent monooxygenase, partial [Cyanobium sp.]
MAALAMADAGWSVNVVDPLDAESLSSRERAYALTHSSRRLLESLDLWSDLEPRLSPFRRLHLCDTGASAALTFEPSDLPSAAARLGTLPLGWIVRHRDLMAVLLSRLRARPTVALHLGVDPRGVSTPPVQLVLAADGPSSPTRDSLGIRCWRLPYRQSCLTVQAELRGAVGGQAWELLRPEGPFAVLPLGEYRAQLVWSAPASRGRQRQDLPDSALLEILAAVLPDGFEADGLLDAPRSFPVFLEIARRLHRGSTLLVGESAHRCHPVGGQGLNLCWRDVAELHRLAARVRYHHSGCQQHPVSHAG